MYVFCMLFFRILTIKQLRIGLPVRFLILFMASHGINATFNMRNEFVVTLSSGTTVAAASPV